jgi:predicted RNA-binding protein with RPS1 domain
MIYADFCFGKRDRQRRVTSIQDGDIVLTSTSNLMVWFTPLNSAIRQIWRLETRRCIRRAAGRCQRSACIVSSQSQVAACLGEHRDSYENGTVIKGTVISKTKGGLIVDCGGLETFLPGSQIDIKPIIDYDAYVGKTMEFKVVKINEQIKNAVVSHKALIESDLAEQREAIIASLEKGQVLEGLVKNITDFGAFLDLGGVDGLLYITDISWGRINHPSEVLALNQKINVVVLDFRREQEAYFSGSEAACNHIHGKYSTKRSEGSTVKGKIVNIEDYGAFLEIMPGVEGLIHVSEVSWSNQPINAREYLSLDRNTKPRWLLSIAKIARCLCLSSSFPKIHGVRSKSVSQKAAATPAR